MADDTPLDMPTIAAALEAMKPSDTLVEIIGTDLVLWSHDKTKNMALRFDKIGFNKSLDELRQRYFTPQIGALKNIIRFRDHG